MTPHDLLLSEIAARSIKSTSFNEGILTADRYVKTISECVGSDLCYRYASNKSTSFDDLMKKAAKTLTYRNDEMIVEEIYGKTYDLTDKDGDSIELPKNTLMVFKHVLTTPKKDRDGDVMRTQGAIPDPKMLLLWQHVATLPIGKLLRVVEHNSKRLVNVSAIIDMNELSHDSAVMIDNGMGRFSHGFRALEFDKMKAENGMEGGFDVKKYEVMEQSLVSIPSNTDAETLEVIVGLAEGGKLTSAIMKAAGKSIRSKMNKTVSVPIDVAGLKFEVSLKAIENGTTEEHGTEKSTKCTGDAGCGCGCGKGSAPKETDLSGSHEGRTEEKEMKCPKCGGAMHDGICNKCGYKFDDKDSVEVENKGAGTASLNSAAKSHAASLISSGKVDKASGWSGPSAEIENAYLKEHGPEEYGKWFLAIHAGTDPKTKAHYGYPFSSNFETVSRAGLVAIRQRAGQQDASGIFAAAGDLLTKIDGSKGSEEKSFKGGPGSGPHGGMGALQKLHSMSDAANDKSHQASYHTFGVSHGQPNYFADKALEHSHKALSHALGAGRALESGFGSIHAQIHEASKSHRDAAEMHEKTSKALKEREGSPGTKVEALKESQALHDSAAKAHHAAVQAHADYYGSLNPPKDFVLDGTKEGRSISSHNMGKLKLCHKCMKSVHDSEHLLSHSGKAQLQEGMGHLKEVMGNGTAEEPMFGGEDDFEVAKKAMANFLLFSSTDQKLKMAEAVKTMLDLSDMEATTNLYKSLASAEKR